MEKNYLEHRNIAVGTHSADKCAGEFCTIHNRSDHHMRHMKQEWRWDKGIMERICEHGIGHPDPDEINGDGIHGCDLCCVGKVEVVSVSLNTEDNNKEYMEKIYNILDEWSCISSANLEDFYDAMVELERREKALTDFINTPCGDKKCKTCGGNNDKS